MLPQRYPISSLHEEVFHAHFLVRHGEPLSDLFRNVAVGWAVAVRVGVAVVAAFVAVVMVVTVRAAAVSMTVSMGAVTMPVPMPLLSLRTLSQLILLPPLKSLLKLLPHLRLVDLQVNDDDHSTGLDGFREREDGLSWVGDVVEDEGGEGVVGGGADEGGDGGDVGGEEVGREGSEAVVLVGFALRVILRPHHHADSHGMSALILHPPQYGKGRLIQQQRRTPSTIPWLISIPTSSPIFSSFLSRLATLPVTSSVR